MRRRWLLTCLLAAVLAFASCGGDDDGGDDSSPTTSAAPTGASGSGDDCFREQKADDNDVRIVVVNNNAVGGLSLRVTSAAHGEEVFCSEISSDIAGPTNVVVSAETGDVVEFAVRNETQGVTFSFPCTLDSLGADGDATVSFDWGNTVKGICEDGFEPAIVG